MKLNKLLQNISFSIFNNIVTYVHKKRLNETLGYSNKYFDLQLKRTLIKKNVNNDMRIRNLVQMVAQVVDIKNKKVLCVGARSIYEIETFKSFGAKEVIGIDLFSETPEIKIMDMHNMDFEDNSFDILFSCHSLEHARNYEKALSEFKRVIKNNGIIAIEAPVNYKTDEVDIWDFKSGTNLKKLIGYGFIKEILLEEINKRKNPNYERSDILRLIIRSNKSKSIAKNINPKELISVLIINYNSSDFIALSLYALKKLTKSRYKVYLLDNNSRIDDYNNLKRISKNYKNTSVDRSHTLLRGSEAHAEGINYLVNKIDTLYFCILDADATWLIKDWDKKLINKLKEKVKVIGTEASHPEKSKDFPYVFAILLETKTFRDLNIDFSPGNLNKFKDVGYKMREAYFKKKYKGYVIKFKNTRSFKEGPYRELTGVGEYYLDGDYTNIFASHFGRGSTLGIAKYATGYKRILSYVPLLGRTIFELIGQREKRKWINISRNIIDKQLTS